MPLLSVERDAASTMASTMVITAVFGHRGSGATGPPIDAPRQSPSRIFRLPHEAFYGHLQMIRPIGRLVTC